MFKFCVIIVVAAQIMGRSSGTIPDLLALPIGLTKDYQAITIGKLNQVGYVAVAFNALCQVPVVDLTLVCAVCNQDCIYAHNALGGNCGPDPLIQGAIACLCAYTQQEADALHVSVDTKYTCSYGIVPESAINVQDALFKPVIQERSHVLLCGSIGLFGLFGFFGYTRTTACYTDCSANHGRLGGTCRVLSPRAKGSGYVKNLYCECI